MTGACGASGSSAGCGQGQARPQQVPAVGPRLADRLEVGADHHPAAFGLRIPSPGPADQQDPGPADLGRRLQQTPACWRGGPRRRWRRPATGRDARAAASDGPAEPNRRSGRSARGRPPRTGTPVAARSPHHGQAGQHQPCGPDPDPGPPRGPRRGPAAPSPRRPGPRRAANSPARLWMTVRCPSWSSVAARWSRSRITVSGVDRRRPSRSCRSGPTGAARWVSRASALQGAGDLIAVGLLQGRDQRRPDQIDVGRGAGPIGEVHPQRQRTAARPGPGRPSGGPGSAAVRPRRTGSRSARRWSGGC